MEWFHLSNQFEDGGGRWCIEGFIPKRDAIIEHIKEGRMFCFVNGRPVDGGAILHRIEQSWRIYVGQRRLSPTCVVYIWLSRGEFDVNLSPDKRTIMFVHEDILITQLTAFLELHYPRFEQKFVFQF